MNTEAATPKRDTWATMRKIYGTSGRLNYALIAVKNGIALGATMQPPGFTSKAGTPYLVYSIHVRAAPLKAVESEGLELPESNVVGLGQGKLSSYWPAFEFEKEDAQRASGDLIAYFPGGAFVKKDGTVELPAALADGTAAKAVVEKIMEIAGDAFIVTPAEALTALYQERDEALIKQIKMQFEHQKDEASLIAQSAGTVVSSASFVKAMKDAYEEKHGKSEEDKAQEAFVEDEDTDEEGEDAEDEEAEGDDNDD